MAGTERNQITVLSVALSQIDRIRASVVEFQLEQVSGRSPPQNLLIAFNSDFTDIKGSVLSVKASLPDDQISDVIVEVSLPQQKLSQDRKTDLCTSIEIGSPFRLKIGIAGRIGILFPEEGIQGGIVIRLAPISFKAEIHFFAFSDQHSEQGRPVGFKSRGFVKSQRSRQKSKIRQDIFYALLPGEKSREDAAVDRAYAQG